jgi:thiol-disulfide isomerase/thioredoxin
MKEIYTLTKLILFCIFFMSCRQSPPNQAGTDSDAQLEVIYFHTAMRCPACLAIEENTKKVLDDYFKPQMAKGIIKFTSCNIDAKENKPLVEKYQVSYLTLLILKEDGTKTDFTKSSFQYAETKPEKFRELLKAEIDKNLN